MIEASELSKSFKDRKRGQILAVDRVSFTCRPGEIYGLLGANGAGKTTTLRLLATILRASSGDATVAGFALSRDPQSVRARIGFLSTATALYGRLTARELVEYFGRLHGINPPRLGQRVDDLFSKLGICEFANGRCDKLSTGMKQRVSIARSIVHDPPVMVFDEPTNGLDVMASRAIVDFIRQCRAEGKTVIFSSHNMSEVEKLCDRVGIIHGGRLLAEGTPAELRARTGSSDLEEAFVHIVSPQ